MTPNTCVLTLSCTDRIGIVAAVAGRLAEHGCNISESKQYGDPVTGRFFMRVSLSLPAGTDAAQARDLLRPVAEQFTMTWQLHEDARPDRVLVLVSGEGHCLNDLLYRGRTGALAGQIVGVLSNHDTFAPLVSSYDLPFFHVPVTAATKPAAERELLRIVAEQHVDLVVLARYMQVLSPTVCTELDGRIINIHHSFLPGFKGAAPYRQARDRGVKLIGATAHYVTAALDEGPIIEQDVARVDHSHSEAALAAVGRDVECIVLARAVRWHLEHRVLLDGRTTVVFR